MLIGIFIGISIMIAFFLCVYIGLKISIKKQDKTIKSSKEELEELRKHDEGIKNIMNYDINVAYGKRVNK